MQHDILWYCQNISFFKTSKSSDISTQIIEFKNLDSSEVLSSDFPGLRTSTVSLTSATSQASPTYTALFHHKTFWSCLFGSSKCANLQKSLSTIIKEIYWSFNPLEAFRFFHFNVIWLLPLHWKIGKKFKYRVSHRYVDNFGPNFAIFKSTYFKK